MINGLHRLEYRGYDSAGDCLISSLSLLITTLLLSTTLVVEKLIMLSASFYYLTPYFISGVGVDAPGSREIILIKKQGKVAILEEEISTS